MKNVRIYKHLVLLLMLLSIGTGQTLAQEVLLGDANNDGIVNGDDVTLVLNYIHAETSTLPNEVAADANRDNTIDIGDVTAIVNIINTKTPDKGTTSTLLYTVATVEKTFGEAFFTPTIYRTGSTGAITYARTAGDDICMVNATTGEITITHAGSCTITATLAADADCGEATASFNLEVAKAPNSFTTRPSIEDFLYGQPLALTPAVAEFGDVVYKYSNLPDGEYGNYDDVVGGNAGTWYVRAFVEETADYMGAVSDPVSFSISKVDAAVTAAPTAVSDDLTYNKDYQDLFTPGAAETPLMYLVTTTPEKPDETDDVKATFSETIEPQTDAGNYYLWYYVKGDANHDDSGILPSEGTISKAIAPVTGVVVTITGNHAEVTYNGNQQEARSYTAEADNDLYSCEPTNSYFTFNGIDVAQATNVGTHNMGLSATDFTNTNPNFASVTFDVTDGYLIISPKDLTITANAQTITYGDDISKTTDDVTVEGLVEGDALTEITLSKTATDYQADPYDDNITASDAVITREEATVTGNYNITYASGDLTILKAASSVTTAPTPVGDLTYNGTAQQLFNAGSVTGGTMMYRVTTTDEPLENTDEVKATFSETIEQKADVGTYYLWYYVKGDANHDDTSVTFAGVNEIHMATNTISGTPTINAWTYGEDANSPSGCTATFGTVVYKYNNAHDGTYGTYDDVVKGNAGEWFVKAFVEGTDNYTAAESEATQFNIHKAAPAVTAPTPVYDELTYNGTARQLFNAGSVNGGTMKYLLTTTPDNPAETDEVKATFSETIEQQADAGTYYLWYYVKGDANHDDTFVTSAGVKEIHKAAPAVTAPTPVDDELTYNGTARQLFNAGSVTGGTMKYLLTTTPDKPDETDEVKATFSETIEPQTDAGTYYLWYYVAGDANHDDTSVTPAGVKEIKKAGLTVTITGNHVEVPYNGVNQSVEGYTVEIGTDLYSNQDFTFSGDASAGGMNASDDPYYMDLRVSQFTNNNSNFDVAFNVTDGYLKINPKALTITAKEQTINYDDEISSTPGNVDVDGLVDGDALTSITLSKTATDYSADPYISNITASDAVITREEATVTGNYTITYNPGNLTINKAASSVTAAPTGKTLTYTGTAQELVTEGSAAGGTLVYSLEENGAYSADIPTATDAGEYPVYYKVAGDGNHTDTDPASVSAIINQADNQITGTLTIGDWTYGQEAKSPSGCTAAFGTVEYKYSESYDGEYGTYAAKVRGNAGVWFVKAFVEGTANYKGAQSEPTSFSISMADPIASFPTAVDGSFTYNGTAQTLFNAGSVKGGTMMYKVTTTNEQPENTPEVRATFTTTIPQQTNAGTYYLWFYVEGDGNYYDIGISFAAQKEIHKAHNEISGTLEINYWTYGEEAQSPSGCTATFGDIVYMYSNAHDGEYGDYEDVVKGYAGTWFVKAHVEETDNYEGAWSNPSQFTIHKAPASVTDDPTSVGDDITYDDNEHQLFNIGYAEGGTLMYKVTTTNEAPTSTDGFTEEIPLQTNAGTYYLWYYVEGNTNYNGTSIQSAGSKTISKAAGRVTLADDVSECGLDFDSMSYTGSQIVISVDENISGGELSFSVGGNTPDAVGVERNGNFFTITRNTDDHADCIITVTSAATANYEAASATCHVNLEKAGGPE